MSAHHLFVDPTDVGDGEVTISGAEAHHAARVLRLHPGEAITVADGTGRVLDAVVSSVGAVVRAEIAGERTIPSPRPSITLVQALAKGDKLDRVVDASSEIGVRRIVPFASERCVVRWDGDKRARNVERLRSIARASAKQSRSPRITVVDEVTDRPAIEPGELCLVLHGCAGERLRDALPASAPDSIALIVGPEGGLTEREVAAFAGARAVSLGERVLRTELAGPVAAALIGFAYGTLG